MFLLIIEILNFSNFWWELQILQTSQCYLQVFALQSKVDFQTEKSLYVFLDTKMDKTTSLKKLIFTKRSSYKIRDYNKINLLKK